MKIKVRLTNPKCKFEFTKKGEWIDLRAAETVELEGPFANTLNGNRTKRDVEISQRYISLGFAMQLPHGFEALVLPRSSTPFAHGIMMANSQGIIDESYCGNNDIWCFPALVLRGTKIFEGDRIAQFRIQPSQKASIWTKLKWLFTNKIEFEFVDRLENNDRGGLGSTGIK